MIPTREERFQKPECINAISVNIELNWIRHAETEGEARQRQVFIHYVIRRLRHIVNACIPAVVAIMSRKMLGNTIISVALLSDPMKVAW
mmetsp:Transcript_14645/g.28485  ORF Transcript_14645/g.28485 Transcript_14645/m.28485 type:complete len:89 (+) Transcript_14645:1368-1634(+)